MYIKKIEKLGFIEDENQPIWIGNNINFNQFNILYGLNGSGKSSISRLINSFSSKTRERDKEITGSIIIDENNTEITLSNNNDEKRENILVFNRDFIDENLTFHKKDDGIKYDYINISLQDDKNEKKLFELTNKSNKAQNLIKKIKDKQKVLNNTIKTTLVEKLNKNSNNYTITHFEKFFKNYSFNKDYILEEEKLTDQINFLKKNETEHQTIEILTESKLIADVDSLISKINKLLSQEPILEGTKRLSDNPDLKTWISQMYQNMQTNPSKYSSDTCPFCETKQITNDDTSQSFNDFFKTLKNDIEGAYDNIQKDHADIIKSISAINPSEYQNTEFTSKTFTFLNENHTKSYDDFKVLIDGFYGQIKEILTSLTNIAVDKFANIHNQNFNSQSKFLEDFEIIKNSYKENLSSLNKIIKQHNSTFEDKEVKKEEYETNIQNHFYTIEFPRIRTLKKGLSKVEKIKSDYEEEIQKLRLEKTNQIDTFKKTRLEKLNDLLTKTLDIKFVLNAKGHLCLKKNEIDFDINKLSEGEKNIILFTYFISFIQDFKKVTLVIDDPHCSLDTDYQGTIITLIKNEILGKREKITQLFILSHDKNFISSLIRFFEKKADITSYFKINNNKINNNKINISLESTNSDEFSSHKDYLDMYEKIQSFSDDQNNPLPETRSFIERMGGYLYPQYQSLSIEQKASRLFNSDTDKSLANLLAHDNINTPKDQQKKNHHQAISLIMNNENENQYVKNHIKTLQDAIKKKR